jgi:hypothetical protein
MLPLLASAEKRPSALGTLRAALPALAGTSVEALSDELEREAIGWDISKDGERLGRKPLLLVAATRARHVATHRAIAADVSRLADARLTDLYMDTDHSFSDHRVALARAVTDWLHRLN